MRLKFFIAIYLFVISPLPPSNANVFDTPYIIRLSPDIPSCVIEQDCKENYKSIMNGLIRILNIKRSSFGSKQFGVIPSAANMLYLERDLDLELIAEAYVVTCLRRYGLEKCLPPGENDFDEDVTISVKKFDIRGNAILGDRLIEAINGWMSPATDLTENNNIHRLIQSYPSQTKEKLRNFAVMAHAHVWKVGCGVADYIISDNDFIEVLLCAYGPHKLIDGEELYIAFFPPCSRCPIGTSCLNQPRDRELHKMLCKVNEGSIPEHQGIRAPANKISPSFSEVSGPVIILPKDGLYQCSVAEENCKQHLQTLRSQVVYWLNFERVRVANGRQAKLPLATNMLYLVSDPDLEKWAQQYAEICAPGFDERCRLLENSAKYNGEVLVFVKTHDVNARTNAETRVSNAIMKWSFRISNMNEEVLYRFVTSYRYSETDKALQTVAKLVHAHVSQVGCGIADVYVSSYEFKEVIACFYGPPQLEDKENVYIPGVMPCSNCPEKASCFMDVWDGAEVAMCKEIQYGNPVSQKYEISTEKPTTTTFPSTTNTKSERILWECKRLGFSAECLTERMCSPHWIVNKINGYKSITVSGTCVTAGIFRRETLIEKPSCFKFQYIKEENQNPSFLIKVIGFAAQVNSPNGFSTSVSEVRNTNDWTDINLNIPWIGVSVQVGLVVRSYSTSDDQHTIKVRSFKLYNGRCPGS